MVRVEMGVEDRPPRDVERREPEGALGLGVDLLVLRGG